MILHFYSHRAFSSTQKESALSTWISQYPCTLGRSPFHLNFQKALSGGFGPQPLPSIFLLCHVQAAVQASVKRCHQRTFIIKRLYIKGQPGANNTLSQNTAFEPMYRMILILSEKMDSYKRRLKTHILWDLHMLKHQMSVSHGRAQGSAQQGLGRDDGAWKRVWAAVSTVLDRDNRQGVEEGLGSLYTGGIREGEHPTLRDRPLYSVDTSTHTEEERDKSMNVIQIWDQQQIDYFNVHMNFPNRMGI